MLFSGRKVSVGEGETNTSKRGGKRGRGGDMFLEGGGVYFNQNGVPAIDRRAGRGEEKGLEIFFYNSGEGKKNPLV